MLQRGQRGARARAQAAVRPAKQRLFDCERLASLPGEPVLSPATAPDNAIKVVYQVTEKVAEFYQSIFQRNSVDNLGLDLVSSVHYRANFDNAFWNGQQMVYGDGDGRIFSEFYNSPDVIAHELTHGVTQYESGLRYEGESGALNESISDVFGVTFNQWLNQWPATQSDGWLVGAGIMAAQAKAAGKTCLRDMANPGASHCLSPQPSSYERFDPSADVHENSGIPNKAFAVFAQAVGGKTWDRAIRVWYDACTSGMLSSNATFADFARLTIQVAQRAGLSAEVQQAWQAVDLPLATG
jgi:Zn-dependent metalloprotease